MKKKHRDIIVDGKKYGWIADGWNQVKIYKTKNDFVKFEIPERHDITPSIVAALIKDPVSALMLINAEPCPFCGKVVEKANNMLEKTHYVCIHEEDCWLHKTSPHTLIKKGDDLNMWNTRKK